MYKSILHVAALLKGVRFLTNEAYSAGEDESEYAKKNGLNGYP